MVIKGTELPLHKALNQFNGSSGRIGLKGPLDSIAYRESLDLDYAMPTQREGGVTFSVASYGGEVQGIARHLLQVDTSEALRF
ncbi:hypothetical protein PQR14_35240 [Paraburkholderia bryophila]|uniref:hypothetical protein n=1 Tax=Paraburkholderia bryophila TaxID=420952 RepID=UPI0038B81577